MKHWNRLAILWLGVAAVGLLGCPSGDDDDDDDAGMATITVTLDGAGVSGLTVVFSHPDGTIAEEATTDTDGAATAQVQAGMMVTAVVDPVNGGLATVAGIAGGDNIALGMTSQPQITNLGSVDVTLAVQGGAVDYEVQTGNCSFGTSDPGAGPVNVSVDSDCVGGGGQMHLLATALDGNGTPVAYAFDSVAPPTGGGTVAHTMSAWQTNLSQTDATFTNIPTDVTLLAAIPQATRDGMNYETPGNFFAAATAGTVTLMMAPGFDRVAPFYLVPFGGGGNPAAADSVGLVITNLATQPASESYDIGADFLPAIRTYAEDFTNADRPALTWTDDGMAGSTVDGFIVEFGNANVDWTVVAGGDLGGAFTFPELPSSLGINPGGAANDIQIIAADLDWVSDAKAFRETGLSLLSSEGPPANPSGADSVLRATLAGNAFN